MAAINKLLRPRMKKKKKINASLQFRSAQMRRKYWHKIAVMKITSLRQFSQSSHQTVSNWP